MDYIKEHHECGENHIAASHDLASTDYFSWLVKINEMSVLSSTGWGRSNLYLVRFNDSLVGLINIRYEMDKEMQEIYGNIGYGVRPSARNMGFATEMLKFGLEECKKHGMNYAILGCVKENAASAKTMLKCGGQLIKEENGGVYKPGQIKQYYKFNLTSPKEEQETWDLYDENRNLTGECHIRGIGQIPDKRYHLVVHVWIKNSEDKYLIAQRSATRPSYPLKWECVGGSVLKGEDSLTGAIREVQEEVGIALNPESGQLAFTRLRDVIDGRRFGDIMDVWVFNYDGEASLESATTAEVSQTRWVTVEEIKKLYDSGEMVNTLEYFFDEIADGKNN
jgi:predicted acetyltransferase/8-oxo-dGTP pyrophosphatase MutT (NUDIX family)